MIDAAQIAALVPRQFTQHTTIPNGASVQNIAQSILQAEPQATEQAHAFAHLFKGATERQTSQNIYNFLRSLNYVADGYAHQKIKLPSALVSTRTGDCKSYSLFAKAVLNTLNIPAEFVVTTYKYNPENSAHIYVQTENGTTLDGTLERFNYEAPQIKTKTKYSSNMTKVSIMGSAQKQSAVSGLVDEALKALSKQVSNIIGGSLEKFAKNQSAVDTLRKLSTQGVPLLKTQSILFFRGVRFIILAAFRANAAGIATIFKAMPDGERYPIYRLFYALGGNTQQALWPAVNAGATQQALNKAGYTKFLQDAILKGKNNGFGNFDGILKAAWQGSAIGATGVEEAGGTSGLTIVASIITTLLAYAAAHPEQVDKALDKVGTGGGNNTNSGNDVPPAPQQSSILPLGILAALAFS